MDTSELISKIEVELPNAVLEIRPFGRSGDVSVWIEAKSLIQVGELIMRDETHKMDWLENLSVIEIDQALVLTYFVRSSFNDRQMILRVSAAPNSPDEMIDIDSVRTLWPMAELMEHQSGDLFGIRFIGNETAKKTILPDDWIGFPMRKSYLFPSEYCGILHMRPVGRTAPDEFGVHS